MLLGASNSLEIGVIILLVVGGAIALFFVGTGVFTFAACLAETRYLKPVIPIDDADAPSSAKAIELAQEARACGLLFFLVYRDTESSLLKTEFSVFLSPDGVVLMAMPRHINTIGYRLYSRLSDGRWLISAQVLGTENLTPVHERAMLPDCTLRQVLRFHLDRVAEAVAPAVAFEPDTLTDAMLERDRVQAEAMVDAGLARWVDAEQSAWKHTVPGATRMGIHTMLGLAHMSKDMDRAKRYQQVSQPELDWELDAAEPFESK